MNNTDRRIETIFQRIIRLPAESLPQVEVYLDLLASEDKQQKTNHNAVMSLAGSWDMNENDFQDYLIHARQSGIEAFGSGSGL